MLRTTRIILIGTESHYGREILKGVNAYAAMHGHWEYHTGKDNSPETIRGVRAVMCKWNARGILAHVVSDRVERFVRNCGLPVINVTGGRELNLPTVITDNVAIGKMTARHFLDRGFRNFGYCAVTYEASVRKRCQGFCDELAKAGLACDVLTDQAGSNWAKNNRQTARWLRSLKKPVAIMCNFDIRAREVSQACLRLGLRIPNDVALVGVGNDEVVCQTAIPPLSSVDPQVQQIGYEAARLLDRLIHGGKAPAAPVLIPPSRVVTRQSSDVVAIEDPDIASAAQFIREHAHEPITIKDLMEAIPISRRSLELRFTKYLGRTPMVELAHVRIEKAKILLGTTDLPIPAVAERSGYMAHPIFSAFFRRQTGQSPTEYRRQSRVGGMGR